MHMRFAFTVLFGKIRESAAGALDQGGEGRVLLRSVRFCLTRSTRHWCCQVHQAAQIGRDNC